MLGSITTRFVLGQLPRVPELGAGNPLVQVSLQLHTPSGLGQANVP